jgi:bacillolysin
VKITQNQKYLRLGFVGWGCFLQICFLAQVFGFRAEPEPATNQKSNFTSSTARSIPPNKKQLLAAGDLQKAGVSVQWDTLVNSPSSVRGKSLGVKPVTGQSKSASVFVGTYGQRSVAVLQNLAPLYGIGDAASELKPKGIDQMDELGFRHQRLSQVYRGVPVVGADLKVHFDKQGVPYEVSGRFIPGVALDPKPLINANQAIASAVADFVNKRGFPQAKTIEQPQLVIYAMGNPPQLAYQLVISNDGADIYRYYVDAKTGAVINAISEVCSIVKPSSNGKAATIKGTILSGEGGRVLSMAGWSENQVYYMYNPAGYNYVFNNDGAETAPPSISSANSAYPDGGTYAYRTSADWGTSDPAEVSVAANIAYTMNYFKTVHNRNSVDDTGVIVPTVSHFGQNYVNAFWSGGTPGYMAFGDGDGSTATCLATLDVCGHEVTHGVTQYTAGLIYKDESGALNESFSDIFGATIEFNFQADDRSNYPNKKPGTADWLLGEDCWLSSTALRDLRNPANSATVGSGGVQPSKYKGTYWYTGTGDNGGVHINSGVQNFFYYLLCEGGTGTNDGISYRVTGITITNARRVAYRALTVYCSGSTDYKAVRNAWVSAAQDLNPSWTSSVKAAWDAVGVAATGITSGLSVTATRNSPMTPYTITATDNPTSYTATGLPAGLRLSGAIISGTPTTKGTSASTISALTSAGTYTATLNFTITEAPSTNNDNFANARLLEDFSFLDKASSSSASRETGEPAHAGQTATKSLWWKWTAVGNGRLQVNTKGSSFDTVLAVYKGSSLGALTPVTSNDNVATSVKYSQVDFTTIRGTTYYFAVDGKSGASGAVILNGIGTSLAGPSNDNFTSATSVSGTTWTTSGSNFNATRETDEQNHGSTSGYSSVWFSWSPTVSGLYTLSTSGSGFDTLVGVYTGTDFSSLTQVAVNNNSTTGVTWSKVRFTATAGTTYYIAVDGSNKGSGRYSLKMSK